MQGLGFRVSANQGFRVKDLGFQMLPGTPVNVDLGRCSLCVCIYALFHFSSFGIRIPFRVPVMAWVSRISRIRPHVSYSLYSLEWELYRGALQGLLRGILEVQTIAQSHHTVCGLGLRVSVQFTCRAYGALFCT